MTIILYIVLFVVFAYILAIFLLKVIRPKYEKPINWRFLARSMPEDVEFNGVTKKDINRDWTDLECEVFTKDVMAFLKEETGEDYLGEVILANFVENEVRWQHTIMWKFTKLLLWDALKEMIEHSKGGKYNQ